MMETSGQMHEFPTSLSGEMHDNGSNVSVQELTFDQQLLSYGITDAELARLYELKRIIQESGDEVERILEKLKHL